MEVKPAEGIDKLVFGMKRHDVSQVYGSPDKEFEDEDGNTVFLYNRDKMRLTFYEDEDNRLGYIISSNPHLRFQGIALIGRNPDDVKADLEQHGFRSWEQEEFDMAVSHYNEQHWITLEAEFNEVVKLELGAKIEDDEFIWKF